jgi:hypothetical protein
MFGAAAPDLQEAAARVKRAKKANTRVVAFILKGVSGIVVAEARSKCMGKNRYCARHRTKFYPVLSLGEFVF